jgi:hypothetical protein
MAAQTINPGQNLTKPALTIAPHNWGIGARYAAASPAGRTTKRRLDRILSG